MWIMRHQWRDGKYNLLPMHPGVLSTVSQSNSLISSSPPYPHLSGFFYHWNKIQNSYWAHNAFAYVVPTSWMVPPPNIHAPCLPLLLLQPFPLSLSLLHPSSLVLMTQKKWGPGSTSYSCLWSLFSRGIIFYFVILWGFLYVIYFRFVGEKRAPQKKVLSWRRQRMQESRCRSRSTNSLNPEISTTTCADPPLPGSGILRSRCASFYSKTHPHSL